MKIITTQKKQCDCNATSSGPRFIISPFKIEGDKATATVEWVMMACDKCNKPFKITTRKVK